MRAGVEAWKEEQQIMNSIERDLKNSNLPKNEVIEFYYNRVKKC